jgi:hypothetical protein
MHRKTPRRVDGNDLIPVVLSYVGNRAIRLLDAGIVEGHIDAAEGCNSLIHGGFYIIGLPHIASDSNGPTSEFLDQSSCLLDALFRYIRYDDACTFLCERDCSRPADAACRARDECDFTGEALGVIDGHVLLLLSF